MPRFSSTQAGSKDSSKTRPSSGRRCSASISVSERPREFAFESATHVPVNCWRSRVNAYIRAIAPTAGRGDRNGPQHWGGQTPCLRESPTRRRIEFSIFSHIYESIPAPVSLGTGRDHLARQRGGAASQTG